MSVMRKLALLVAVCILAMLIPFSFVSAEGEDITEFKFALEYVYADGRMIIQCENVNGSSPYTFYQQIEFSDWLSVGGWMANDEGIAKLQYSLDGEEWFDTEKPKFSLRSDLAPAGIPYEEGHKTAGFGAGNNCIPASAITEDNCMINVRAVTLEGNFVEFFSFNDVTVVEPGEGTGPEVLYNTYLDDVTDGYIETPNGVCSPTSAIVETDSGKPISFRGWACSNYGISKIVYSIDNSELIDDVTGPYVKRQDVMNAYPVYTAEQGNTDHVGLGKPNNFITLPKTAELEAGFYSVDVYAVTADGTDQYYIASFTLVVDGGGSPKATNTPEVTPTEAPAVTAEPEATETTAPEETTAANTPEPASNETAKKGCGGVIGGSAVMLIAVLAIASFKKKSHG